MPSPLQIAVAFGGLARDGDLLVHAGASLTRAAAGFALSVIAGTALGISMARSRRLERFVQPLASLVYPLPKSALIPVLMIWLGIGDVSKIAVIFLGTILPVLVSAHHGARGIDRFVIWSARNCGTSERALLFRIILPAALPDILSGVRMALALTFVLLVSSELLVAQSGLGYLISSFGEGGHYPAMFAVVLTVSALGFLADRLFLLVMKGLLRWRDA